MKEVHIKKIENNISVNYTGRKIDLPGDYSQKVEEHWNSLIKSGRNFFRGDVFTITKIDDGDSSINITVEKTDYAHFLYTIYKESYEEYDCRVIYTSALVETSDKKFVFGEMNDCTASPRKLQFVGGGIDGDDIEDGIIDLRHSIKKEIYEELGINTGNKSIVKELRPYLLKSGGDSNFLSAVFKLDLLIDEAELMDRYTGYCSKLEQEGINPEFKSLTFIKADSESVEDFVRTNKNQTDENLFPALKAALEDNNP